MGKIAQATLIFAVLFSATVLHAQLQLSNAQLAEIESITPTPANELPIFGNFYSAANPSWPPLPENVSLLPSWDLGDGYYLLDDLNGNGSGGGFERMDDFEPPIPGGGDGGGDSLNDVTNTYSFPTNGLWLQITNISAGSIYVDLNGATDFVYEIFSTTNLAVGPVIPDWNIETEVFPGADTNTVPFAVTASGRSPLFLWARDWTGVTSNGNTTPEWWLYYWFGTAGLRLSDSDMDPNGNTIHYDYTRNLDPNPIEFSITASQYVNTNLVPMQLDVSAGNPASVALVDSTNFIPEGEAWYAYTSSNIIANLALIEGQHDVWIGLKSWQTNATATWQETVLTLDTNLPIVAVTNLERYRHERSVRNKWMGT